MSTDKFEAWAIVELFGHQRVAGRVSEQAIGGETFVRVDIPRVDEFAEVDEFYTRLFGKGAIYCINVTDERAARVAAKQICARPAYAWELQRAARLQVQTEKEPEQAKDEETEDDEILF